MINEKDIIYIELDKSELDECIDVAKYLSRHIIDRDDLHKRDDLERFINVLMGEVAEQMVIKWLHNNGKKANSTVNKTTTKPDLGHDIQVHKKEDDSALLCSVKSSISYKLDINGVLNICKLATKKSELRDINIQVYFWLVLEPKKDESRVTVPSLRQAAIIGWFGKNDLLKFSTYNHELRETPLEPLRTGRTMNSLLQRLQ